MLIWLREGYSVPIILLESGECSDLQIKFMRIVDKPLSLPQISKPLPFNLHCLSFFKAISCSESHQFLFSYMSIRCCILWQLIRVYTVYFRLSVPLKGKYSTFYRSNDPVSSEFFILIKALEKVLIPAKNIDFLLQQFLHENIWTMPSENVSSTTHKLQIQIYSTHAQSFSQTFGLH